MPCCFGWPWSFLTNEIHCCLGCFLLWAAANGGVTNGGLRGVWLEISRNRPKSPFFCLFRPFPEGPKSTREIQKTEEKVFPQISSDLLKPPSLKPPFAALQLLLFQGCSEGPKVKFPWCFALFSPKSAAAFWGFSRGGCPENACIGGAISERNLCEICRRKSPQNTEKHKTKLCAEVPERPLPKDPFFQLLTKHQ